MAMRMRAALAVLLMAASVLAAGAAAQSSGTPACASKLVGCASSMNGTDAEKPPETCCGPLRDAVKNERACLCALYASPEIFKAFNINVTDALRLSKRCGVTEDVSSCPSTSPTNSPPGSSSSPSGGKSAGHRTMSASFVGLMSLFLVLWSALA
uniref:Predicted protein n=1 Tax=Hordeum vulgare subsp. vulgare TaxID=112509 RepID=F2D791_HORVV|nr:predicted protein [Hordeum vulgare subsp. vulgare]BAK01130.1 predicted protein [Hordeum vulgare subsp. vulgare]BAK01511.1 predicted protein [Hordeum vulgare subsp. vulgare]